MILYFFIEVYQFGDKFRVFLSDIKYHIVQKSQRAIVNHSICLILIGLLRSLWSDHRALLIYLEERLGMKKCRQKHGGFWPLLTPYGSSAYRYLPLTNRDPELLRRPSPPWFLQKTLWLGCFRGKIKEKIGFFSLVDASICKNNVEMFLLAGKNLETFNFISFYWLSLHFDSQSLQK